MKPKYIYSSHRTRNLEKINKQREKYPNLADKIVAISDIVIQVLDARYIEETRNLETEELIKESGKTIIFALNKCDLIDTSKVDKKKLEELYPYCFTSATERIGSQRLRDIIKQHLRKIEKIESKTLKGGQLKLTGGEDKITVGIIGYPNTGKSSLINLLIGRSAARVGSDAGFTRGVQKLKLSEDIILLDSPGVIPRDEYSGIDYVKIARHTKVGGRSYSQVRDPEMIVHHLMQSHKGVFEEHYELKDVDNNAEILIEKLGTRLGFYKKGKVVDEDKVSRLILKDIQTGKIQLPTEVIKRPEESEEEKAEIEEERKSYRKPRHKKTKSELDKPKRPYYPPKS